MFIKIGYILPTLHTKIFCAETRVQTENTLYRKNTLVEQTSNTEARTRRLEAVNHNLFSNIIRLTRRMEILEETPKR